MFEESIACVGNDICTLSRKRTSFRQSENVIVLVRIRIRVGLSENALSVKRVFEQV